MRDPVRRHARKHSTHHEANNTIIELYLDKNEVGDDGAHTVQTVVVMRAAFLCVSCLLVTILNAAS